MPLPKKPSNGPQKPRDAGSLPQIQEQVSQPVPPQQPQYAPQIPQQVPQVHNPYDEEDPFESIDISDEEFFDDVEEPSQKEESEEEIEEEEEEKEEEEIVDVRKKKPAKKKFKKGYTEDTFIDEKNAKLKPYGRGKRKAKVNEFDNRKNLRKKARAIQFFVIGLLVLLVGLGVKNALVPPKVFTEDEISEISQKANGITAFPIERGKGFVQDFMKAYLSLNNDETSKKVLNYYYAGSVKGEDSSWNSTKESRIDNFNQKILAGPTIYEVRSDKDYSARYVVGALTIKTDKKGKTIGDPQNSFFSVNVYYDQKTDKMVIVEDSPTVVSPPDIDSVSKLPQPLSYGQADEDLTAEVSSVVTGYIKGYATSSSTKHSELDQYVIPKASPELFRGFDGRYTIGEDDIQFEAYPPGEISSDVIVDIEVTWTDSFSEKENVKYKSSYIMILQKQDNGKYLVSKFSPKMFVEAEKEK